MTNIKIVKVGGIETLDSDLLDRRKRDRDWKAYEIRGEETNMAEFQSTIRATRTKNGGAVAELIVRTSEGPVRFSANVSPADAARLHNEVKRQLAAGTPPAISSKMAITSLDGDIAPTPPRKKVGLIQFGKGPDALMTPTFKPAPHRAPKGPDDVLPPSGRKSSQRAIDPDDVMPPSGRKSSQKPVGPDDVLPPTFMRGVESVTNDAVMGLALRRLNKRTPREYKKALAFAARNAIGANYYEDPAFRTNRLPLTSRKWNSTKSTMTLRPQKTALGEISPDDPEYWNSHFSKFAARRDGATKSTMSFRPTKTALGETIEFDGVKFVDDEDHNPMDELSRWVAEPLGVPQSNEEAAVISGDAMVSEEELKGAKLALIEKFRKGKPGSLQALKYEGQGNDGRLNFRVRTTDGEKLYQVKRGAGGWLITTTSMSGEVVPVTANEVMQSKSLLVQRLIKNRVPVQAVKYEGKSATTGRHKFLVMLPQQKLAGYEIAKSPGGWAITTMSGTEVGFLKKIKSAAKSVGRTVGKTAAKAGKITRVTTAARGVARGVARGTSAAAKFTGKKIVKPTGKGLKKVGKGLKKIGKAVVAIPKSLGGLLGIKKKMAAMKRAAAQKLAIRRANFLVWKKTKGKQRKAPPTLVKQQLGWASKIIEDAAAKSKAGPTLKKLEAAQKGAAKVSGVGSYGRYDMLAASDGLPVPTMEGWSEVGIMWSNMWNPLYWLELAIRGAMKNPLAPEELPGEYAEEDEGGEGGEFAEEGYGEEGGYGEGGEEFAEEGGYGEESYMESGDEDFMEGDFVGATKNFKNRSPQYKKVAEALKAAGVPVIAKAQWPKATWVKAKQIAFSIAGPRRGRRILLRISRNNQIKVQHTDGRWKIGRWGSGAQLLSGETSLGKAEARPTASSIVLDAVRRASLPLTPAAGQKRPRWSKKQYDHANKVAIAALKTKKFKNHSVLGRNHVKVVIRNHKVLVQGPSGVWYEVKTGTKLTKVGGALPPNFETKRKLVRDAFIKMRDRHERALKAQGVSYSNKLRVNQLALTDLKKAGLPVGLLKFNPASGALLADKPVPTITPAISGDDLVGYDEAAIEEQRFIEEDLGSGKSERDMFDEGLWIEEEDVEPEAEALEEEIEVDEDLYDTDEPHLWMRPALVGSDEVGVMSPAGNISKLWWQPVSYFRDRHTNILRAAGTAIATFGPAEGGGGGGGPSGGGGGGGGGGDDESEEGEEDPGEEYEEEYEEGSDE